MRRHESRVLQIAELASGVGVATAVTFVAIPVLLRAFTVSAGYPGLEVVFAGTVLAAGAAVTFAAYRHAVRNDSSWLRLARTAALFFVVLAVVGQASIGLLLLPAAALTLLTLFVARWRGRVPVR